ncbi:PEP-CTERM sorting domain-containing protein [Ideonella sp.]|uniref:PEP-CTERM sorting domain-containing protein n=1 Tax=Ideonella sp. TaxID=1929293 RepID=UPI003BB78418
MHPNLKTATVALGLSLLGSVCAAQSAINTYSGSDDAADTSGPWTQSAAAETSFGSAAAGFGSLQTLTFEAQALGMGGFTQGNASVAISGSDYGNGFSGVSNTTFGNLYGFNVTSGGSQWLGAPAGSATFTFAGGTHAFGAYFTGLQTVFSGSSLMVVTFNDGTSQTLAVPVNANGGASYFGFTNTNAFSSVTLSNVSNDAWGVDNVSFTVTSVPEPGSMALMVAGLAMVGAARRRRANRAL